MLAVALPIAIAMATCGGSAPPQFRGTDLSEPSQVAPEFSLRDQFGEPVSLSDRRGDVVILTFLYTYCPDICPVVAGHLADVYDALAQNPDTIAQVSLIAVSVDPQRDTVERAHEYSSQYGMLNTWSYLVGTEEDLAEVWADYYVSAAPTDGEPTHDESGSTDAQVEQIAAAYTVSHQAPVYLIDRQGRMRVLFTLPFSPRDVVADVRTLLK